MITMNAATTTERDARMAAAPAFVIGDLLAPIRLTRPPSAVPVGCRPNHDGTSRRATIGPTQGATPNRHAAAIMASCSRIPWWLLEILAPTPSESAKVRAVSPA